MAGIAVLDVTKRFNGFTALHDVSLAIPEGSLRSSTRVSAHHSAGAPFSSA